MPRRACARFALLSPPHKPFRRINVLFGENGFRVYLPLKRRRPRRIIRFRLKEGRAVGATAILTSYREKLVLIFFRSHMLMKIVYTFEGSLLREIRLEFEEN